MTAASGSLYARDRQFLPDTGPAWTGSAVVPAGRTLSVKSVTLVTESVTSGIPVLKFRHGSQTVNYMEIQNGWRQQIFTLAPAQEPLVVTAPDNADVVIDMELNVNRPGPEDAVLQARYTLDAQPPTEGAAQRLRVSTLTGAGTPYMAILGRMN